MSIVRAALVSGLLVLGATSASEARLVRLPPPEAPPAADARSEALAWSALRTAAAAEASGLAADLGDWPGRAELAARRGAARAFEQAVPGSLRARAASWHASARATYAAARTLAGAGATLHRLAARAGGAAAAADRLLDAAALLTIAGVALHRAVRPRGAAAR